MSGSAEKAGSVNLPPEAQVAEGDGPVSAEKKDSVKPGSLEWMVTVAYPAMFALYQVINDPELLALVANASSVKRGLPEDCSFTWRTRGDGGGLKSWDHQCTCWHRVSLIAVVHRCHCGAVKAEEKGKR